MQAVVWLGTARYLGRCKSGERTEYDLWWGLCLKASLSHDPYKGTRLLGSSLVLILTSAVIRWHLLST